MTNLPVFNPREAFDQLAEVLASVGLTWIIDQVRAEIAEGITVEKFTSAAGEIVVPLDEPFTGRSTHSVGFSSQPYSEAEALGLLVGAIRRVVNQPIDLEQAVNALFSGRLGGGQLAGGILFLDGSDNVSVDRIVARRDGPTVDHLESVHQLNALLDAIVAPQNSP